MINDLKRPTLLVDRQKAKNNIRRMAQKAIQHGMKLSPHFKTHQSIGIGKWFLSEGVDSATASSISMARYFVENGWKDVTVVFPLNIREIQEVSRIAEKARVTVLIDGLETVRLIESKVDYPVLFLLEIDAGYHRTGIDSMNFSLINQILDAVEKNENLFFSGFYCHSGDTYKCKSKNEIKEIHDRTVNALTRLRKEFSYRNPDLILSLGDTPACSITDNFEGIDIIRPGNFVFYDLMQKQLEVCSYDDIAIVMACPVVFKNQDRMEVTIYGGGVHFSKDSLIEDGITHFGRLVEIEDNGWSEPLQDCYLKSISQEHGVMKVSQDVFDHLSIGEIVGILPVHSCMTADLMGEYLTLDGEKLDHMSGPKFRD